MKTEKKEVPKLRAGEDIGDGIRNILRDAIEVKMEDQGIGAYEFWGALGYDSQIVSVVQNTELVVDVTDALDKEMTAEEQIPAEISGTVEGQLCHADCDECREPSHSSKPCGGYKVRWEIKLEEIKVEAGRTIVVFGFC